MSSAVSIAIKDAQAGWETASDSFPLIRASRHGPVVEPFRRFGDSIAWLDWCEWCVIKKIETLKPMTGATTRLLELLKSIANRHRIRITGNPTTYEPSCPLATPYRLTQTQLELWYQKRGFLVRKGTHNFLHLWYPDAPGD